LRVGYVSPDFCDHCQSFFTVPLFAAHDRQSFAIHCYADVARPDHITAQLRSTVDEWRDIRGHSDEQVAQLIFEDRIDILVDLSMHMAYGRPLVFARKPAPVQACWFAYPGTTGISTMDYRLTDPYLDPPGHHDSFYAEQSVRLAHTFWSYDPLTTVPEVSPLPALTKGHIRFGSLNNFCKINAVTLRHWAQVLRAVDRSELVMLAPTGSCRENTLSFLAQEGISPERVAFIERQPRIKYLEQYHLIDIGLDTLPYNGHVTSLDALWMGVPTVTLVGTTIAGRAGFSQLTNLGLPELIAKTPEQFQEIAIGLVKDLPRLSLLRASLRQRMRNSPLMDTQSFARDIEAAYKNMWHNWCSARTGNARRIRRDTPGRND
jgi:predicted O-linked N-acetylglucosamine transferase (SPINDLY family)